jgi:hypothetical protein
VLDFGNKNLTDLVLLDINKSIKCLIISNNNINEISEGNRETREIYNNIHELIIS